MKKITYTIGFAFALLVTSNAVAQQGFGTNTPDKSSAIEIKSTNKGLLIPRIALTSNTDQTTINNPANSLLVYNTTSTTTSGLNTGYYYWNATATKWIPFVDGQNQDSVTVTQDGQNLSVVGTPTTNVNGSTTTDYKVKITPGTDQQFLATKLVSGELKTTWLDYTDITNLITAENGLTKTGNTIKLGGDFTDDTIIDTKTFNLFIKGLSQVTDMADQVVAVGHYQSGEVKVATPAQIVSAGLTHDLTSAGNTMTSTINTIGEDANIINSNVLSLDTSNDLISTINGIPSNALDLEAAIIAEQVKYEVIAGTGVSVGTNNTDPKNIKYTVNAAAGGIVMGGDVTGNADANTVVRIQNIPVNTTDPTTGQVLKFVGTEWTPSTLTTTDVTDGKTLSSTSLTVSPLTNKALLQDVSLEITPGTAGQILTTTGTGASTTTTWANPNSLVQVDNGLRKATGDVIHLGGTLKEVTTITTSAANTLAISGLQPATETATNKVIVSEGTTGILRTVERVVTGTNVNVASNTGYSFFAPEVVINVTLGNTDQAITFPSASDAKGQTISIKIANTTDTHTGYLNLLDTYGSMPYQGWIVKSNGTDWVIVGRN